MFGKKRFRHENNGNYGIVGVGTLISIMLIVWGIYIIIKAFEKHTNFYIPSNIYEIIGDVALFSIAFMVWYFGYIFNNGINGRLTDLQPISGRCIYVEKIEYGKKEKYKPYYEYYVGTVYFLHEEEIKYPAKKATTVNSTKMLYYCSKRKAVITKEEFKRNRKIKVSGIILCLLCFVAIIQDLIRF